MDGRKRGTWAAVMGTALVTLAGARGDGRLALAPERQSIAALAPVEVLASGFRQPSAIAVETSGAVLVVDRAAGTLTRIGHNGASEPLVDGLHQPDGLAVDGTGGIIVLEAAARRILRIGADGRAVVMASMPRRPRAIAVGPDGRLWVALRDEGSGGDVIARLDESGALTEVAAGLVGVGGLAAARGAIYVATARLAGERGPRRTVVARMTLHEDGTVGHVESLLSDKADRVAGLAVDALGDLFVGAVPGGERLGREGVVLKRHRTGEVTGLAAGLHGAAALAFAPGGDLIALEPRYPGRVLRFRAPPPPMPVAPAFTNRTPLPIGGHALAGDRVQLFEPPPGSDPVVTTIAGVSGEFTLAAPLVPNARSTFMFRATAAGGRGLTSAGVMASITHDDVLPRVMALEPAPGAHVRRAVVLRGRGEDDGSGVAAVSFLLNDTLVASVSNPAPPDALAASAVLETGGVAEGPHTLTTTAVDRAGNARAAAQLLVVDRTPPETAIASGPGTETIERRVRFDVAGTDVWSPALEFSWRLDEGSWTAYGPATVIDLVQLSSGPHRFEVRARDLAGNEDPTPAAQAFTVIVLRVRITAPAPDSVITMPTVWVRGVVEGAEPIVIRALLPSELRGVLPADFLVIPAVAGTFAVEVPVTPTMTAVTVTAASRGNTATDVVPISVQPAGAASAGGFGVWPPAGLAPQAVRFEARALPPGTYELDADGDGVADYTGESPDGAEFVYGSPGVHLAALRLTTGSGDTRTWQAAVQVYDQSSLEAQVRMVWDGFREALRGGDVDRAAALVHSSRRAPWEEYFRQFTADAFAAVDAVFTEVFVTDVAPGRVECEMLREVGGTPHSFPVSFVVDVDGSWRLWQF